MKKLFILSFFILFSFLSYSKETITWYKVPFPPFFIVEGSDYNKGTMDLMLDIYTKKLNNFDHKTEVISLNRLLEISKKSSMYGTPILMQNSERDEYLLFTEPYDFILSNHFIIKKNNLKYFKEFIDNKGFIDLTHVFGNKKFTIGLEAGRFYHSSLTKLIKDSENIDYNYTVDSQLSIIKKLNSGRIDASIECPEVIDYISKTKKIPLDYIAIPIKGTDPYNLLRFSFPKNDWGSGMIPIMNKLIKDFISTKDFENISLKWSPDKKKYLKNFRETSY